MNRRDDRKSEAVPPEARGSALSDWNDRMYRLHRTPYEGGIARRIQQARVAAVDRLAAIKSSDTVLEIGCESGRLIAGLSPCRMIVGADVSPAALSDAAKHCSGGAREAHFVQLDAQRALPFESGVFDVVVCSEVLEHVADPRAVIEGIHEIANRDTRIVLTIPIEAPKVAAKRVLSGLGLLERFFPGIEAGRSEWHLHSFSRRMLLGLTEDLFRLDAARVVWGCHYVARFYKR